METSLPSFSFSRCVSLISLPPSHPLAPSRHRICANLPPPSPKLSVALLVLPHSRYLFLCHSVLLRAPFSRSRPLTPSFPLPLSVCLPFCEVSLFLFTRMSEMTVAAFSYALTTSAGQRGSRAARSLLLFEIKAIRIALASPSHLRLTSVQFLAR